MPLRLLTLAAVLLAACGVEEAPAESEHLLLCSPEDSVGAKGQALEGDSATYWSSPAGTPVVIPVCFESSTLSTQARRDQIRSVVERQWQRFGRVNFTRWDNCVAAAPGLHVEFHIGGGSSSGIGTQTNAVTNGVRLAIDDESPDGGRFAHVVAHEFGHAIGMNHEETRSDYFPGGDRNQNGIPDDGPIENVAGRCAKQGTPPSTARYYGSYDATSVMSYCGNYCQGSDCGNAHPALSANDIASVQVAYGRRIPGQLVAPTGDCATGIPTYAVNPVRISDCTEPLDNQELLFTASANTLSLAGSNYVNGYCLESPPSGLTGSVVTYPACDGYSGQKWRFDSVFLRGWGGLCLDLQNGNTNGAPVQLWECGALGGVNQRWTVMNTGEVKFGSATSTKCLTQGASSAVVTDCNGSTAQQYDLLPGGSLRRRSSAQCLDATGPRANDYAPPTGAAGFGSPGNGTPVTEFVCLAEQLNQKFNVSGRVLHISTGTCLERAGGSSENGTSLQRGPCNGSDAQVWDYYFK